MNKKELIKKYKALLETFKLTPLDVHVSADGAMVLHGLREETEDIDISMTKEVYWAIRNTGKYPLKYFSLPGLPEIEIVEYKEDIDLHKEDRSASLEVIDGVACYTLEQLLKQKQTLNREKDQLDIAELKDAIKEKQKRHRDLRIEPGKREDALAFHQYRKKMAMDDTHTNALGKEEAVDVVNGHLLDTTAFFLLWSGNEVVGELFILKKPSLKKLHIAKLGILKAYRRKGWAQKLVGKAIKLGIDEGYKTIELNVRKDNEPARSLYEKCLFEHKAPGQNGTLIYIHWLSSIVTRLFILRNGTFYIMLRNGIGAKHPGKRWILPGGQVDPGERAVDSMLRELKEETGISLKEKDVRMFFHAFDPTYQKEMVFYRVETAVKNPSMKEPEKFDMAIWYPLKDIDQLDGLHEARAGMFMKEAVQRLRTIR